METRIKEKPLVLVFSTAYHPCIGGAEIAIAETIERLRDQFDFCIITHRMGRNVPRRETYRGAKIIRLGFGTVFDRMFLFPFLAGCAGLGVMRAHKRAVLWGVMVSYASWGAFFIKFFLPRVPFVLTLQEGDSEQHLRRAKLGLVGFSWRILLGRADGATAISTYLARRAKEYGFGGTVSVIPNGADMHKFQATSNKQQAARAPVVITTSRLVKKNGVDILIRAIAQVKKEIPGIRCHVIGDGPERKNLEALARACGARDQIKFFGAVAHADIPRHLFAADIFVRSSRSEGMGNSFVEAMAAGLPVIGTPVGGITDIIEDKKTGLFARPEDPEDVAEKILLLARDSALANAIAAQGNARARERFSWDAIAGRYGDIFSAHTMEKLTLTIATPLVPPALGGVGRYAVHLGEEFEKKGHRVFTVSYARDPAAAKKNIHGDARVIALGYGAGIRHALFFAAMIRAARRSDIVLSLDQFSAGFPAALACLITRTPYLTRMEGDFLWESFVERTRRDIVLADFWRHPPALSFKERIIKRCIFWTLGRAERAVFSSAWRREIAETACPVLKNKSAMIRNVWPAAELPERAATSHEKIIVWAGRMLILKNLDRLIRAFVSLGPTGYRLFLIGEGPEKQHLEDLARTDPGGRVVIMPPQARHELLASIRSAAFFVLPSLSDVGPNVIGDALAAGIPFVMTRESGYWEFFSGLGIAVSPLDEADIAAGIGRMMDDGVRREYRAAIRERYRARGWSHAADEWLKLSESMP